MATEMRAEFARTLQEMQTQESGQSYWTRAAKKFVPEIQVFKPAIDASQASSEADPSAQQVCLAASYLDKVLPKPTAEGLLSVLSSMSPAQRAKVLVRTADAFRLNSRQGLLGALGTQRAAAPDPNAAMINRDRTSGSATPAAVSQATTEKAAKTSRSAPRGVCLLAPLGSQGTWSPLHALQPGSLL